MPCVWIVCVGNAEQLKQLLDEADVDADQADEEGRTALHFAGELLIHSWPSKQLGTTLNVFSSSHCILVCRSPLPGHSKGRDACSVRAGGMVGLVCMCS